MSAQLTLLLTPRVKYGAGGGGRTHNLRFRRPLLYPLSYARLLTFARDTSNIAYACPADKPERPPNPFSRKTAYAP